MGNAQLGSLVRATVDGFEDGQLVHREGDVGRVVGIHGGQLLVSYQGVALAQTMTPGEDCELI